MRRLFVVSLACAAMLLAMPVVAKDDPVKADSKHYKVVFENDSVRVLRIAYGPHEKSVMHHHPAGVAVALTDHHVNFTLPDGKTLESRRKAGETWWTEAGDHLPENAADKPMELILVEMKE